MEREEDTFVRVQEWLETYKNTTDEKQRKQLRNLIVVATIPLVKKIAFSLARRATDPIDDLIQVGSLGLIKSIEFFNPGVSAKFKTYASYLIAGEIRHYLRDKASMIKAPREIQELSFRVNTVIKQMIEDGFEDPTNEQVAMAMDLPVQKVNAAIEVERRKSTLSLDQTVTSDDDNLSLIDKIPAGDYQEFLAAYEEKIMLKKAISQLPDDLKEIIEYSYYEDLNQRQIAERIGVSQMHVSRKMRKAFELMYDIITQAENTEGM